MDESAKNVRNIKAGLPFAKTLARYLLQQTKGAPEELARYKILLPTRRACRVLRDSFLSETDGRPLLLPQMTPIGDVEEEDLSLMIFGQEDRFTNIPRAVSPLRRQLLLARLILAMPEYAQGHEHAMALAEALAVFLDHIIIEGLDFKDLYEIVPEDFAAHWQITLDFLKIISESWPKILKENNVIDVAQRRNLLLHALADHWRDYPPAGPVIAAGSTGSIPATANLLSVIAGLDQGMVVLPALDAQMDEQSWVALNETHPQYGLKQLLERMDVSREQVQPLVVQGENVPGVSRAVLASEIMRPAATTPAWKNFKDRADVENMLPGIQYVACDTQQEEAEVIALLMREVLENPEKTAALITPDRNLARRVAAACKRWKIDVDDSAGQNLSESRVGKFSLLLLQAAHLDFDVVSLLAFLKHPLCGIDKSSLPALEADILRTDSRPHSLESLQRIAEEHQDHSVGDFVRIVVAGFKDLQGLQTVQPQQKFADLLQDHIRAAEFFAATKYEAGADMLWAGDDGTAASGFFTDLQEHAHLIGDVSYEAYIHIFRQLISRVTVRASYGLHPRLMILGQLEARLIDADLVILGGLNEGSWPPSIGHDPWMSRPMRQSFGLPAQERSIGMAAHDFVQGFCAQNVVMTRAGRVDGTPTVPARWLERLDTVLQACGLSLDALPPNLALRWARQLDAQEMFTPYTRPAPTPPVVARPRAVSVTRIETWLQDPYAIYAYYTINLRKIRPLVQTSDAALRGQILHTILENFATRHPIDLPDDADRILYEYACDALEVYQMEPEDVNFWWPRFERMSAWFLTQERDWRTRAKFAGAELTGKVEIDVNGRAFTLYGRADRIDRMEGGYAIIDYKSGGTFSARALKKGNLPQLPLEALILEKGRFETEEGGKAIAPGPCAWMGYWKMTGGQKAGEVTGIEAEAQETVQSVEEGLRALIDMFSGPETPFLCIPDADNAPRFNDYEHLSRLKEWAVLDGSSEEAV